jgi:rhodanese-related sulfurtransferase
MTPLQHSSISVSELQRLLTENEEIALLDVRELRQYNAAHPNLARPAPLSQLELSIGAFVPRRSTQVVVFDDANAPGAAAAKAEQVLHRIGYTQVRRLEGGLRGWTSQGLPVAQGFNTLVKAFADLARQHFDTPSLSTVELKTRQQQKLPTLLVDARPLPEYQFLSIAGALNYPGTELALRKMPDSNAPEVWAINCFSRTRGIIGATTLNLLGMEGKAVFVEDGVMAWGLDGQPVVQNAVPGAGIPADSQAALQDKARRLSERYGLQHISPKQFAAFADDSGRTLYVLDLRQVAGGQLLMQYETIIGVRNARIVLADDSHQLRAAVTAFWLTQLNQAEVFILDGEVPALHQASVSASASDERARTPDAIHELTSRAAATVVDVSPSLVYEQGHLPDAYFLLASRLPDLQSLLEQRPDDLLVFTSADGHSARLAARDAAALWPDRHFLWMTGGTNAWQASGYQLVTSYTSEHLLSPFDDDWGSVMRVYGAQRDDAWRSYLSWERTFSAEVAKDPLVRFHWFDAAAIC